MRLGVISFLVMLSTMGAAVFAQEALPLEPTGLQFAAAIEQSLTAAIEKSEKSIVAIARVKRGVAEPFSDPALDPFGGPGLVPQDNSSPSDPDFVPTEYGTGVIVDRAGLILTNFHVLADDSDYYVTTIDGKTYDATVKAGDPRSDLAVLSIQAHDLTPITFGDGAAVKKGQIAIALGNPYAIARDGQPSASWGIISNIQRKAGKTSTEPGSASKTTLHHFGTLIQTDAKLNLGTSGGALVNLKGEMIGLTTSLAAAAGYEQAAGYAIPVDAAFRRAVDSLRQGRVAEYGFLGVSPENLPQTVRDLGRHGALIRTVKAGTPAERAGLMLEDVVTHVNGEAVTDADNLMLKVGSLPADSTVRLTVLRGGKRLPITASLAKFRMPVQPIITDLGPTWRGLRVDHWTALHDFRLDPPEAIDTDGCVVITTVDAETPAARADLKPEMVVTHVDGVRIASPAEFAAAVGKSAGEVVLRLSHPASGAADRTIAAN